MSRVLIYIRLTLRISSFTILHFHPIALILVVLSLPRVCVLFSRWCTVRRFAISSHGTTGRATHRCRGVASSAEPVPDRDRVLSVDSFPASLPPKDRAFPAPFPQDRGPSYFCGPLASPNHLVVVWSVSTRIHAP